MDEIQALFSKLEDKLDDTIPIMAEIANVLYNQSMKSFEDQESPSGLPWQRLADSTVESKKHPEKMLYEEGSLKLSMSLYADRTTAEIGSNSDYAAIHQFGGKTGRNHASTIPARPYMPLQENGDLYPEAWEGIFDILDEFWEDVSKG